MATKETVASIRRLESGKSQEKSRLIYHALNYLRDVPYTINRRRNFRGCFNFPSWVRPEHGSEALHHDVQSGFHDDEDP